MADRRDDSSKKKRREWRDPWEDQWEHDKAWRFREAKSYEDLARELIEGPIAQRLTATQRARKAWYDATGSIERSHTKGIYLKEFEGGKREPVLFVYIDSSVHVQEFTTKKDIYLARLASRGFMVSGLEFRLSKKIGKTTDKKTPEKKPAALAELTAEELLYAENLAKGLQEPLRSSFLKAMIMSMRREKTKDMPDSENDS